MRLQNYINLSSLQSISQPLKEKGEALQWIALNKGHNHTMSIAVNCLRYRKFMVFQCLAKVINRISSQKESTVRISSSMKGQLVRTFIKANSFSAARRDKYSQLKLLLCFKQSRFDLTALNETLPSLCSFIAITVPSSFATSNISKNPQMNKICLMLFLNYQQE